MLAGSKLRNALCDSIEWKVFEVGRTLLRRWNSWPHLCEFRKRLWLPFRFGILAKLNSEADRNQNRSSGSWHPREKVPTIICDSSPWTWSFHSLAIHPNSADKVSYPCWWTQTLLPKLKWELPQRRHCWCQPTQMVCQMEAPWSRSTRIQLLEDGRKFLNSNWKKIVIGENLRVKYPVSIKYQASKNQTIAFQVQTAFYWNDSVAVITHSFTAPCTRICMSLIRGHIKDIFPKGKKTKYY